MLNYFEIINQYITPGSRTYKIYVVHAILVTNKALEIGRKLELSSESMQFIEEAGMLHDIGVVRVNSAKMDCCGDLPYIAHGVEGAKILRAWQAEKNGNIRGGDGIEESEKVEGDKEVENDGGIEDGVADKKINLERHALVAERHVGVGLKAEEVARRDLPLPHDIDFVPESLEEQIITYADLFFSKREETLWRAESADEIEAELTGYGEEQVETFRAWREKFGD